MRRTLSVVLGMLMVAVGCGDDGGSDDDRAAAPETSERTTSTTIDEWAVPDEITEAYVERVLTELYRIQGEALRTTMTEGAVTPEVGELLDSIYSTELAHDYARQLNDAVVNSFDEIRPSPGDVTFADVSLSSASTQCVVVNATLDFRRVAEEPPSPYASSFALARSDGNQTHWMIAGVSVGGSVSCD